MDSSRSHYFRFIRNLLLLLSTLALPSAALPQVPGAFVVRAPGDGPHTDFVTLQEAVDAVPSGSLILVRSDAESGATISGKSLTILNGTDRDISLENIDIVGLAIDQSILLRGFDIGVLSIDDSEGVVLVESCHTALFLENGSPCLVVDSEVWGGAGYFGNATIGFWVETGAQVATYDTRVIGGSAFQYACDSSTAARVSVADLYAADSEFVGGSCFVSKEVSVSTAMLLLGNSSARLRNTPLTPGSAGGQTAAPYFASPGSTVLFIEDVRRELRIEPLVLSGQSVQVDVVGGPLETVWVGHSQTLQYDLDEATESVFALALPLGGLEAVTLDVDGRGSLTFDLPLAAGLSHETHYFQALHQSQTGSVYGPPAAVIVGDEGLPLWPIQADLVEVSAPDQQLGVASASLAEIGERSLDVAYGSAHDEYLVVFTAPVESGGVTRNWIQGQRIDAATGIPVGPPLQVSNTNPAEQAAVAYNPGADEYLVVWNQLDPGEGLEIHAQRLAGATGAELGADDYTISSNGPAGNLFAVGSPTLLFNDVVQDYFVAWSGDGFPGAIFPGEFVVFYQRLDGLDGSPIGSALQVTFGGDVYDDIEPSIALRDPLGNMVIAYTSQNHVFVQAVGTDAVDMSPPQDLTDFNSSEPHVAYSTISELCLASWKGRVPGSGQSGNQVVIQALNSDGLPIGEQLELTQGFSYTAISRVVADDTLGLFQVVWSGRPPGSPTSIYSRLVDARQILPIGIAQQQISDPTDTNFGAKGPVPALRAGSTQGIVVWNEALQADSPRELIYQPTEFCADPASATQTVRLGSPPNPAALTSASTGPILGQAWPAEVDHTSFAPSASLDVLVLGFGSENLGTEFGTLLVDLQPAVLQTEVAGVPFATPIPASCTLIGLAVFAQAVSIEPDGALALTNALDLTLGTN